MVDFLVSERQQVGNWWTARADDLHETEKILDGVLLLEPHPPWKIPEKINWEADPFNQKNWRFQFHCLKWLDPLRRVALAGGDEAERAKNYWNLVIESWIDENLLGHDKFAWMDMADGVRAIELVVGAPLASPILMPKLVDALRIHLDRLDDISRRSVGNHALHQLQGLFVVACFLEEKDIAGRVANEILELFDNEFDDEGTNAEAAVSYHDLNYNWWIQALERLAREGYTIGVALRKLERSRSKIVHFVRPDGFLEMIGDTGEFKRLSKDGFLNTDFVLSQGEEGEMPKSNFIELQAGYILGRSGWGGNGRHFSDETFYSLRFGNNRAVHGHDDQGSATIFANRVPWIVDPGMYAYQNHPFRPYFLSRQAHNLVSSPETKTVPDTGILEWSVHDDRIDAYSVRMSPYRGFSIRRVLVYLKHFESFLFFDEVERIDKNVPIPEFVQQWNFHPDTDVSLGKMTAQLRNQGKTAMMRWLNRPKLDLVRGQEEPLAGWFSPSYGVAVPTNMVRAVPTQRGILNWSTVLSVGDYDIIPRKVYRTVGGIAFSFDEGNRSIMLTVGSEGSTLWYPRN